jgi:hypothetical protein
VSMSIRIQRNGIQRVLDYCPDLEYLCLHLGEAQDVGIRRRWERAIKKGLKKLKCLSIDYERVEVGCEWMGYDVWLGAFMLGF